MGTVDVHYVNCPIWGWNDSMVYGIEVAKVGRRIKVVKVGRQIGISIVVKFGRRIGISRVWTRQIVNFGLVR